MKIEIRQINESDWLQFSRIRLTALQSDPQVFGSNYEREAQYVEEDWRSRLRDPASAVFMLFERETTVGMTGVTIDRNDESGKTAVFWGTWLAPQYRGRGLSELIYKTRIDWAKQNPNIEKIIVSHRESNLPSKFANQKHGFKFTHSIEKQWIDGKTENEVFYELFIKR